MADAAAVLDDSGRVLGIMPHPERACEKVLGSQDGLAMFRAAHRYLTNQEAA
jgi:phosphoribosylformylglycinamidine synthase